MDRRSDPLEHLVREGQPVRGLAELDPVIIGCRVMLPLQIVRVSTKWSEGCDEARARSMRGMGRSRRVGATRTAVPSQREDQKALTRSRLIDAALAVFLDKGYAATTIDDIVTRAGVSRATFYLHFASKLDLIVAIRQPIVQSTSELTELLPSAVSRGRTGISEWLNLALDHWESFAPAFWAIQQADQVERDLPEEVSTMRADTVRSIVQGLGSESRLSEGDQQVRARAAWGLLQDLFDHYAANGWTHGRATVHKALLDAWVALLT